MPKTARHRVVWVLNAACPSRCTYCDIDSQRRTKTLDAAQVRRIADEIVEAGFREVTFVGGEPLLSPELPVAIEALEGRCGMALFTGGIPGDPKRWVELVRRVDRVVLSIDSGDDALNDRVRGRAGITRDLLAMADLFRTLDVDLAVNSVVSAATVEAIEGLWPRIRAYRPTTWALTLAGDNFQGSPQGHFLPRDAIERLYLETAPRLAREIATQLLVLPVPVPLLNVPVRRWTAVDGLGGFFDDFARGDYNAAFSARYGCPLPGVDISIGVGGEVYPCSQAPILQPQWAVGDLKTQRLADVLGRLEGFTRGVPHAPCRRCWAPSNVASQTLVKLLRDGRAA